MGLITMILMAMGVVLSTISGIVCYLGGGSVLSQLGWMPGSDLVIANPSMAFGVGAVLVVFSILCHPRRVH